MRPKSDRSNNLRLDIELKNIGPHSDTHLVKNVSSINMAIFAENGSGKSFISKSFRRITERKRLDEADSESVRALIKKSAPMISFGEREGTLSFSLRPASGMEVRSSIRFMPNSLPEISEDSDPLIFYVFNSEYVRENLEAVHYRPEDKVSGFILGKVNIDLSRERQELSRLEEQGKALRANIEKAIANALSELHGSGVQQNTTEYRQITFESVSKRAKTAEKRPYEEVRALYETFLALPEGIEDLPKTEEPDLSRLKAIAAEIQALLEGEFTLSYFEEAFKKEISPKQDFVERGLELSDGERCPFCGQTYNDAAHKLIDRYTAFLENEEASVLRRIQQAQAEIRRYSGQVALIIQKNASLNAKYNGLRKYFPSFANDEWNLIDVDISALCDSICVALDRKKSNIREVISEPKLDALKSAVETVADDIRKNNLTAFRLNSAKNNSTSERLRLRKALCSAMLNQLITAEEPNLEQLFQIGEAFLEQKRLIEEKESQARIDKKALVVSELQRILDRFFSGKYQFDPERFCITFRDNALLENTEDVLSDGEKSILALCYYFANVHAVIEREHEYSRLCFVLDDPVSSMDFNYVYNVAQTIRDIGSIPNITSYVRFIVLTHNMEFMSILVRNHIVKQKYVLANGIFEDFNDHYVMPYMWNLIDIYNVANRAEKPRHTIPNSIRHLLETIYRFEGSQGEFTDFILSQVKLREKGSLYSLIEDQSHGGWRESKGYTDETIIDACLGVIEYLRAEYPGQIQEVEAILEAR